MSRKGDFVKSGVDLVLGGVALGLLALIFMPSRSVLESGAKEFDFSPKSAYIEGIEGKVNLYNFDSDALVDGIGANERASSLLYVADGYQSIAKQRGLMGIATELMSSEMRASASKAYNR